MTEGAVEPVVGVLPDRAGVEHDQIGKVTSGRIGVALEGDVPRGVEDPGQTLGVMDVHLTSEGANLVGPAGVALGMRVLRRRLQVGHESIHAGQGTQGDAWAANSASTTFTANPVG